MVVEQRRAVMLAWQMLAESRTLPGCNKIIIFLARQGVQTKKNTHTPLVTTSPPELAFLGCSLDFSNFWQHTTCLISLSQE
jgi:hypothetical protein